MSVPMKRRSILLLLLIALRSASAEEITTSDGQVFNTSTLKRSGGNIMVNVTVPGGGTIVMGVPVAKITKVAFIEPPELSKAKVAAEKGNAQEVISLTSDFVAKQGEFRDLPGSWWPEMARLRLLAFVSAGQDREAAELARQLGALKAPGFEDLSRGGCLFAPLASKDNEAVVVGAKLLPRIGGGQGSALAQLALGKALFAKKDFQGALRAFLTIKVFYPSQSLLQPPALFGAAYAYAGLNDQKRALQSLKDLLENYPASSRAAEAKKTIASELVVAPGITPASSASSTAETRVAGANDGEKSRLPVPPTGYEWQLVPELSDEFNGSDLDANKWERGGSGRKSQPPGLFDPKNVSVKDGMLRLVISSDIKAMTDVRNPKEDLWIRAAALSSKSKTAQQGYYEASVKASKMPATSSFRLQGNDMEINVATLIGHSPKRLGSRQMTMNTHYFKKEEGKDPSRLSKGSRYVMPSSPAEEFHVYGVWWKDADTVCFYHNGVKVAEIQPSGPFENTPQDIIFDAEPFPAEGLPSLQELADPLRNTMSVNWCRSWKLVKKGDSPAPSSPAKP